MTPWEIKAKEFVNCNCAYGCPCQFNALPTHGNCQAAVAMEIEQGHYGDVKLDGLRIGGTISGPARYTRAAANASRSSTSVPTPSSARRSSRS
jgi:hypothetical protein